MSKSKQEITDRHDTVVECAKLFFTDKLTKNKVAQRLSVSPMQVTRYIREAERSGIVHVSIRPNPNLENLATAVMERWRLQRVNVIEHCDDYDELKKRLGRGAAAVFDEQVNLRVTPTVGIGGGSTIHEMVEAIEERPRKITVYPMAMFGRGPEVTYFDSTYVATFLYLKARPTAKAYILSVPPLPRDRDAARGFSAMLRQSIQEVGQVIDGARRVDLAFVGLGAFLPFDDIVRSLAKAGLGAAELKARGVAGGINYNYFDGAGKQIGDVLLTVGIADLKRLSADSAKLICLVAGGEHKLRAIRTALDNRMASGLVTDSMTAERLLSGGDENGRH